MADWFAGYVQANGINVHYYRGGATGQPPLLLLHGITDSGLVWTRVARAMGNRYDIIMTDARGHGASDDLKTGFSIPMLADDAAGVIQALGLEKAYLWGHSMGAITAALVAANYPELALAAVLEDPPFLAEPPQSDSSREQDAARRRPTFPDFRSLTPEERLTIAAAMNPGWHPDEIPPWVESKTQFDPAIAQHFMSFQDYPWRDVLRRIACPTLLITGDPELGAIITPATAREAVQLMHARELERISGAGHNIHRDRYDETMAAVHAFLSRY